MRLTLEQQWERASLLSASGLDYDVRAERRWNTRTEGPDR